MLVGMGSTAAVGGVVDEHVNENRLRRLTSLPGRVARSVSIIEVGLLLWFTWSAWRSKWLSDDGYIYLAYVRNLTENGWGPVLNQGERVEGFTSPAWYALLSIVSWLRPDAVLDLRQAVLVASMLLSITAAALWVVIESRAATLMAGTPNDEVTPSDELPEDEVRRLERLLPPQGRLNLPLAVLAAWYPLHSFATSGLETPLQLLVTMAVILYVWSGSDHNWMVGVLAALLPLVRPELGLVSVLLLARHGWRCRRARSSIALGIFVAVNVGVLLVRIAIYGQLFPNTYYAKTDTGHGVDSGLEYLGDLTIAYGLHWIAAAAVVVVVVPVLKVAPDRLDPATGRRVWFLVAAVLLTMYVVAIGGDFMHARFLLSEVLLLAAVFAGLGTEAVRRFSTSVRRRAGSAAVVTVVLLLAAANTQPLQAVLPLEARGRPAKFRRCCRRGASVPLP